MFYLIFPNIYHLSNKNELQRWNNLWQFFLVSKWNLHAWNLLDLQEKWTSGKKHRLCFKLTGNRFEMLVEHNNQEKLIRFHFVVEVLANCG